MVLIEAAGPTLEIESMILMAGLIAL